MKILISISINVEVAGEPSPGVDARLQIGNSGAVLRSEAHLT